MLSLDLSMRDGSELIVPSWYFDRRSNYAILNSQGPCKVYIVNGCYELRTVASTSAYLLHGRPRLSAREKQLQPGLVVHFSFLHLQFPVFKSFWENKKVQDVFIPTLQSLLSRKVEWRWFLTANNLVEIAKRNSSLRRAEMWFGVEAIGVGSCDRDWLHSVESTQCVHWHHKSEAHIQLNSKR